MTNDTINFEMGPSQTWPTLDAHVATALMKKLQSMSHRGYKPGRFPYDVYEPTIKNIKKFVGLPQNENWELYYGPDATTFMRSSVNLFTTYDRVVIISNGAFGERWHKELVIQGRINNLTFFKPEILGDAVNLYSLKENKLVKMVCVTLNETSFGIQYSKDEIASLRTTYPNAIICVDGVSGFPGVEIPYDCADYILCSGHKLFGIMPGVGFCLMNKRAIDRAKSVFDATGTSYGVSLVDLHKSYQKFETPCTPNTLGIFSHGMVAGDMYDFGLNKLQERMYMRSRWLYDFFDKKESCARVANETHASVTSIVIDTSHVTNDSSNLIHEFSESGIIIAGGYGNYASKHIRIANYFAIDDNSFGHFQDVASSIFK